MTLTSAFIFALSACAVTAHPQTNLDQVFDYVIIGAGTSGLVVANRLSENPSVSVAVIEAGDSVYNNPNVTSVKGYGLAFGTEIDYAFQTVPDAGGLNQTMRAGKAIGGTSTINGMAYIRAQDVQIDAWEALGNEGWNWKSLLPYYIKSETIQPPTAEAVAAGYHFKPAVHGTNGPLKVGWPSGNANASAQGMVQTTFEHLNVSTLLDVNDGIMNGYYQYPETVDVTANIRHDAARAYYWPYANRTNLKLFSNTFANRIMWAQPSQGHATATGVNITANGTTSVIRARKEVILSAGALRSPVILEHSGVGNPAILAAAGVDVVVDLPTVGENLQDQTNAGLSAESTASISGIQTYVAYPAAHDIWGADVPAVKAALVANLTAYAEATSNRSNNVTKAADLLSFFKMQLDLVFDGRTPILEVIIGTTGGISASSWTLLPFARGNIHITSSNTTAPAAIDPNYFGLEWDLFSQIASFRYIRRIFATKPLSSIVGVETVPSFEAVPANATDAEWHAWLKTSYRSNFHPVATAAMLPKEAGGVVDSKLKVYGTANVRVVDASILPFQVCGHLVSTLYAVAEKAADIIKAEA